MFLRKKDYFKQIQEDNLDIIIEDSLGVPQEIFLTECEAAALKEVQSYLSGRYDVAKIFKPLLVWDAGTAHVIGDYVAVSPVESGAIYTALTDNTNSEPTANPLDWKLEDSRDALMKTYLIDITLYHVHTRINPRNIKALVMSRRDEAVKWLGMIAKGTIIADLPAKSEDMTADDLISWGSETKRKNSY